MQDARRGYTFNTKAGKYTDRFELVRFQQLLATETTPANVYASDKMLYIRQPDQTERKYYLLGIDGRVITDFTVKGTATLPLTLSAGVYLVADDNHAYKIVVD